MKKPAAPKSDADKLKAIRKTVRQFLYETEGVPYRAVDCDQDRVDRLIDRLYEQSGART